MAKTVGSLFNLNRENYAPVVSAGAFTPVGSVPINRGANIQIADLLAGLTPPSSDPVFPNINVDVNALQSLIQGVPDYITQIKNEWLQENPTGFYGVQNKFDTPDYYFKFTPLIGSRPTRSTGETQESYEIRLANYNMQQKYLARTNEIKNLTSQYNTEATARANAINSYNSEVNAYNTEKNSRVAGVNALVIDPAYVTQQRAESRGQILGSTDLYSDQLHQLMLNKVGEANSDAGVPAADSMSSLFAR